MMWLRECINSGINLKILTHTKSNFAYLFNLSAKCFPQLHSKWRVTYIGADMIEKPTHKKANPTTIFTTNN